MKKTKLISSLKTLNKSEWFQFRKYLLMEVRPDSEVFILFEFLQSKKDSLEKFEDSETIRQKHFSKYPHKHFLNLLSRLYNIFEDWLTFYQLKKEKHQGTLLLIKALNDKGLYKHANQKAKTLNNKLTQQKTIDTEKNIAFWQLQHNQYYSDNPIKYEEGPSILENLNDAFLIQFKEQALLYITELYNWGDVQNHDYNKSITTLKSILCNIKESTHSKVVNELINLVSKNDLKALQYLKEQLYKECFTRGSQLHTLIFFYILTSSLRMWRIGLYQDADELSRVYDYGFNSGILLHEDKITQRRFHNIISTLGVIKSKSWALEFTDKWHTHVDSGNKKSTQKLAYAQIYFIHKEYDEIIKLTRNLEFDDYESKLRSLGLELISFYEERENYGNILDNVIHNFRRTLKRNKLKVTESFYLSNINLIKFIQQMLKRKYQKIDINLNDYNNLIYRTWCSETLKKN